MPNFQRLDWDSKFFGFGVGCVDGALTNLDLQSLQKFASDEDLTCVYWFADTDDAMGAKTAQENGFRYVDTRLTFERKLEGNTISDVRPANTDDLPALKSLARKAHNNTRFFYDGNFDHERCEDLYELWLERSFDGVLADEVLTYEYEGAAAGYVTVKLREDFAQIGLIAVSDGAQGLGIGKRLVHGANALALEAGLHTMKVATQSRNVGAQRLYVGCGFKPVEAMDIYHWWPARGPL